MAIVLFTVAEAAGERMEALGGTYLPPKSLPERGWTRQAGLTFRLSYCLKDAGYGLRDLSSAEELAEAGGER